MKCRCGYEAPARDFLTEPLIQNPPYHNFECPGCGNNHGGILSHAESIVLDIIQPTYCYGSQGVKHYPVKREVYLLKPNKRGIGAAGVRCQLCDWGQGGGISVEDYDRLQALLLVKP